MRPRTQLSRSKARTTSRPQRDGSLVTDLFQEMKLLAGQILRHIAPRYLFPVFEVLLHSPYKCFAYIAASIFERVTFAEDTLQVEAICSEAVLWIRADSGAADIRIRRELPENSVYRWGLRYCSHNVSTFILDNALNGDPMGTEKFILV